MLPTVINLEEKFGKFTEQWTPKVVAQVNDFQFKLARLQGDFVWHRHADTDEVFQVVRGELRVDFRDGSVALSAGEMLVIPAGVEHKPYAEKECQVMLFVRTGTINTGDAQESALTNDSSQWV